MGNPTHPPKLMFKKLGNSQENVYMNLVLIPKIESYSFPEEY